MTSAVMRRPAEDYLMGYESATGKWIPGLLDIVSGLQKRETYFIYAIFGLAVAHFFGINTLSDVIKLVRAF